MNQYAESWQALLLLYQDDLLTTSPVFKFFLNSFLLPNCQPCKLNLASPFFTFLYHYVIKFLDSKLCGQFC